MTVTTDHVDPVVSHPPYPLTGIVAGGEQMAVSRNLFPDITSSAKTSPAHELTRICAPAVIFIKGVSPSRLLSVAPGDAINITALLEPGLKLMSEYERNIRDLLEWKIARYRALAREAGDDQTARRIQTLVRELELQLRAEQPDAG